ncbi:Murein DD-endopeptidase MepM and murein hydrolase activator NlpD, contain LysM domain [Filimonas lacunae]|uniref:Murein DD-endopeptidase MepM and murein hydrolase activator NlpD, contain LysM domain n=1 Tax=Filimonas lacunae TaxID=477680 RepID=A0A1N7L6X0_9BACT|nr:peptidoglycan DD-metalloendopeptidase family protein [Filimonas lacunae]SIS69574.1 Murein DD-endopeptidase MepM and murein hydrolase activator NlpD, contain LysM domain [Filimonas lacunae]
MKKIKYFYNTHTLRYEKLITPLRIKLLRILGFVAAAIVTASIIVAIAFQYVDSPKEKVLKQQNEDLKQSYSVFQEKLRQLQQQMTELQNRDNNVYRAIFEAAPIPDSARLKEMEKNKEVQLVQGMGETQLVQEMTTQLNLLSKRAAFQEKSYKEIDGMLKDKEKLLAAIPAIQPVSNKDLNRIASGFGYRVDPVYKVTKFHAGLDFTAPQGTPIYATADGVIKEANFNAGGYGNHVVINHGYGYETLYGHMYKIKAKPGDHVRRGEVIGYVGSTGKSTGPHCHYEVHRSGERVDPVYYFSNDLSPDQFDRLLKLAAASNQSFD